MNKTKKYQKMYRKSRNTKKSRKMSKKIKRIHIHLTKKYRRRGGMVRQVLGPVRKGMTNVAEEYGKNILKDEMFHKQGRLSNRVTNTLNLQRVAKPYSNDSLQNIPKYPAYIPKTSDLIYNDENQENIQPNNNTSNINYSKILQDPF